MNQAYSDSFSTVGLLAGVVLLSLASACSLYFDDAGDRGRQNPPPSLPPAVDAGFVAPTDARPGGFTDAGTPNSGQCEDPNSDCCEVCTWVSRCIGNPRVMEECLPTCVASAYVPSNGTQCLALRVYWVDEEGCRAIVPAYLDFDPNDTCTE